MLTPTALLEPIQRNNPRPGLESSKVIFLTVEIGRDVMAKQSKETGDGECLVAVSEHRIVYGVLVEVERQKGYSGVDGDHEEDADDTTKGHCQPSSHQIQLSNHLLSLFPRFQIMCAMARYEVSGHDHRNKSKDGGNDETKPMEGEVLP